MKCELCDSESDWLDEHHVSYEPEETITVCRDCHADIHNTNKYPDLKPDVEDLSEYYNRHELHVDLGKVPSRDGWTTQIKYIPCNNDGCPNCPHGPYYYYYQRQGDTVRCEYGGMVTEDMLADQATLSDFSAGSEA